MKVLVIAPHPDDELIGVGGTIAKRTKDGHDVYVCVVTKGTESLFDNKIIQQGRDECIKADSLLGVKKTQFLNLPAVMLETVPRYELNEKIANAIKAIMPDEIYIPHRGDMQLDHQLVVDATMVAARPNSDHIISRVYSYETLSETGWNIPNSINTFIPTVYENIEDTIELKMKAMSIYKSQLYNFPNARSLKAIQSLAEYRGATVKCRAAEAFCLIREIKK